MSFRGRKFCPLSLICLYPMVSSFVMSMIWSFSQVYFPPFMGGYYFKWVFLYTENNPDWLGGELLVRSQVYYSIYIIFYFILTVLTLLALFFRRGKVLSAWMICFVWLTDSGWIVWDMVSSGVRWQGIVNLAEHMIFLIWTIVFSLAYIRLKKASPELFKRKKRKRMEKKYYNRF